MVAGKPADPSIPCNYPRENIRVSLVVESAIHRQWGMVGRFKKELEARLEQDAESAVIHDHGMWLATNRAAAQVAREQQVTRIVSPGVCLPNGRSTEAVGKKAWRGDCSNIAI